MSDSTADQRRAQSEAADWFARLSRPISNDTAREYQAWRRRNGNAAAYRAVETAWAASGALATDSEVRAATAEAVRRRPPLATRGRAGLPPLILGLGAAAAVAAAVVAGLMFLQAPPVYRTHVGEMRVVTLPDGTRMRLNTDSRARVRYSPGERRIDLSRGEAFFEVRHNPARPFIVVADGAQVRATGTTFDVWRDGGAVRVSLLEGEVRVSHAGQPDAAILKPNQRLSVSALGISPPEATDAAAATAWTSGQLVFRALPLDEAVAEINRYGLHKVVLEVGPALARQPVSGSFNTGDTAAFVAAVHTLFDVRVVTQDGGDVRLLPPSSSDD